MTRAAVPIRSAVAGSTPASTPGLVSRNSRNAASADRSGGRSRTAASSASSNAAMPS